MKPSFSYYIVTNFIKLKGIKKIFSQSPIPYHLLRRDDIYSPKNKFYNNKPIIDTILKSTIHHFTKSNSEELSIYIHGGAFVSGPAKHHWDSIQKIYQNTNQNIWFVNYPKAPEHQIAEVHNNILSIYLEAIKIFPKEKISIIGDSAGGTLIIKLIQSLEEYLYPKQIILISPVLDSSLDHPAIKKIENLDIMLSVEGVKSAKQMSLGNNNLKDPNISPLFGNLKKFPKTTIFIGTYDITSIDQKIFAQKLNLNNTDLNLIIEEKMPHIWPLLPFMRESTIALKQIIQLLK